MRNDCLPQKYKASGFRGYLAHEIGRLSVLQLISNLSVFASSSHSIAVPTAELEVLLLSDRTQNLVYRQLSQPFEANLSNQIQSLVQHRDLSNQVETHADLT